MFKKSLLILLAAMSSISALAQREDHDYTWWNEQHNWNGTKSWQDYLTLSSKYMGPNALPVSQVHNGRIKEQTTLEAGIAGHISTGDKTTNAFLDLFFSITNKAGLSIYWVPAEAYTMDEQTSRYTRNTRDYDGNGLAVGDVYIQSYYQIVQDKTKLPDILLAVGIKTASGNNLEAARYTDTPGYFFNLSAGKKLSIKSKLFTSVRPYAMAGFYAYQTYRDDYRQDDALMYGIGIALETKNFIIDEHIGGYIGYINNGDRPMVNRLSITSKRDKAINYRLQYQQGIFDFTYSSVMVSAVAEVF